MARRKKVIKRGSDVHTVFRTINKEFLFRTSDDHKIFLRALRRQKRRYRVFQYAWTGMSNHHHIFNQSAYQWHEETPYAKRQKELGIPIPPESMVRDTQSYFSKYFNLIHHREGDLIRDRTRTIKVMGNYHSLKLLLYIFLNPVRAMMVNHPKDYPYSNFRQYAYGETQYEGLFDYHPAYLKLGKSEEKRREVFLFLVEEAMGSWGKSRCGGASEVESKKSYKEFIEHAYDWFESFDIQL